MTIQTTRPASGVAIPNGSTPGGSTILDVMHETLEAATGPVSAADLCAAAMRALTTPQARDAALAEALPYLAKAALNSTRKAPREREPEPQGSVPAKSWKREGIREAVSHREQWLRMRYSVGDGSYVALRDMTREQVEHAVAGLHDLASRSTARAARLESVAKALADHGAETVSALPEDVLDDLLT